MFSHTLLLAAIIPVVYFQTIFGSGVRPHIVFILADDLGWNDVSFHGSPEIPTPNIDALAASGVVLHSFYTCSQCTPSRGSLMTGKYPINIGLQHFLIQLGEPSGLPLNFTLLPQRLKSLGYSTALVGKWHLGYYKREYTPLYRGFDQFFGYYNGKLDYFDHTAYAQFENEVSWGVDLQDGLKVEKNLRGYYATDLFADKAIKVIQNHNASKPLFLYISQISPHFGNTYAKLQALPEDVKKLKHIKDHDRRIYAGMIYRLDDSVGRVFDALSKKGMLKNSIVVFTTDNGGASMKGAIGPGSNWPLRGEKLSLWEGGVRVPALIWSPLLELKQPLTSDKLMHVSDWLPTLYSAAGGNVANLGEIDGINMWPHLSSGSGSSPRDGLLLNIDRVNSMAAIRVADYKLIQGDLPQSHNKWHGTSGRDMPLQTTMDQWVWKNGSIIKDILERSGWWLVRTPDSWRVNLTVHCGPPPDTACDARKRPCLYNIVKDPCEYYDLSKRYPKIVRKMRALIQEFNASAWPPITQPIDLRSLPVFHGFAHVPWLDDL